MATSFVSCQVHPLTSVSDVCLWNVNTTSNWAGWEVWRFIKLITNNDDDDDDDDGNIYVITSWTHKHKVLCSNPDGRVFSTENKEEDWEKWQISLHPEHHGLQITSVAHGR